MIEVAAAATSTSRAAAANSAEISVCTGVLVTAISHRGEHGLVQAGGRSEAVDGDRRAGRIPEPHGVDLHPGAGSKLDQRQRVEPRGVLSVGEQHDR